MTIKIIFTGENWAEIEAQLRSYRTPSAAEGTEMPLPSFSPAPDPAPEPDDPAPKAKRSHRKLPSIPEIIAATEPAPESTSETVVSKPQPATTSTQEPRDLPSLDVLKAAVTQSVRLAQKKEGPVKILDLLPAFKVKTGLDYVMNAEEKHREALFELLEQAGSVAA